MLGRRALDDDIGRFPQPAERQHRHRLREPRDRRSARAVSRAETAARLNPSMPRSSASATTLPIAPNPPTATRKCPCSNSLRLRRYDGRKITRHGEEARYSIAARRRGNRAASSPIAAAAGSACRIRVSRTTDWRPPGCRTRRLSPSPSGGGLRAHRGARGRGCGRETRQASPARAGRIVGEAGRIGDMHLGDDIGGMRRRLRPEGRRLPRPPMRNAGEQRENELLLPHRICHLSCQRYN
jgi:hypothetical protein